MFVIMLRCMEGVIHQKAACVGTLKDLAFSLSVWQPFAVFNKSKKLLQHRLLCMINTNTTANDIFICLCSSCVKPPQTDEGGGAGVSAYYSINLFHSLKGTSTTKSTYGKCLPCSHYSLPPGTVSTTEMVFIVVVLLPILLCK